MCLAKFRIVDVKSAEKEKGIPLIPDAVGCLKYDGVVDESKLKPVRVLARYMGNDKDGKPIFKPLDPEEPLF